MLIGVAAWASQAPAGGRIWVRVTTPLSSADAKAGDAVRVVAIPSGMPLKGEVVRAVAASPDRRAELQLHFPGARLVDVDNARETIDANGVILGILASETLAGRMDSGIQRIGERYAGLAGVLGAIQSTILPGPETGIVYAAGVELQLELTAPIELPDALAPKPDPEFERTAAAQPFRTTTANTERPSDLINLMLEGNQAEVVAAFHAAGWTEARPLNTASKLETLRAIAAERGYSEAPVSTLLLKGKPPALVFEKLNNTFAKRHHLRIWRMGSRLWLVAATHDIGIDVSQDDRTFIHRIDPNIDDERQRVVDDLLFAGKVKAWELVDRPAVPRLTSNATGDEIHTDGKTAVVILR